MKEPRQYPKQPEHHLITDKDTIKTFSKRKQKSINYLSLLFMQGIPALYSTWTKAKLLFALNILMHRNFQREQPNGTMADYGKYAVQTFANISKIISRLTRGARISRRLVVQSRYKSYDSPLFMPVDVYLSTLTAESIAEIQSSGEPYCKANLEALQKIEPKTEQSSSDKIRHELKQVSPEMREQLLNDLLREQANDNIQQKGS